MSTLKDIAEEAGVSIKTVSRILNGENKEAWPSSIRRAQKIRDIAQRINFRPSAMARTMRTNKTQLIGVLIRNDKGLPTTAPTNYETILGIYHHLEHAGYEMCLVHQSDVGERSRIFREHMLDGLIVLGHMEPLMIQEIRDTFAFCIWADVNVDQPQDCVRRDEFAAGCLIGNAIRERGYEQVEWLGCSSSEQVQHYSQMQRLAGLRHGLGSQLNANLKMHHIVDHSASQFLQILDQARHNTCIVPYDTVMAQMVLNQVSKRYLFPGRDIGVACPDDSVYLHEVSSDLCRVSFDRMQMGQEAARLLLEKLAGTPTPSLTLSAQWVEGGTLKHKADVSL